MKERANRKTCPGCGRNDFLTPITKRCVLCEDSPERCDECHRRHARQPEHVGIRRGVDGKGNPVFVRDR